jgi:hypothetical protein
VQVAVDVVLGLALIAGVLLVVRRVRKHAGDPTDTPEDGGSASADEPEVAPAH